MINLYSDTQTLPTPEMFAAMKSAELGDDVLGADPTVNRLEGESAARFEKEAALLVPSGTMANLSSLIAHGGHGEEIFLDPGAHVYLYEAGGLCSIAGYTPNFLRARRGQPDPQSLLDAIRPANVHFPKPGLLWLENTHNTAGGAVLRPERQAEVIALARQYGLRVHVDGARIFNAAVALGKPVADLVRNADSVSFSLSKGLSCPIGSVVVGSSDFIHRARRARKKLGGGMRQAGIIAACGLVALRDLVDRLREDHQNAKALATVLKDVPGIKANPDEVETNIVLLELPDLKADSYKMCQALKEEGVLVSEMSSKVIRLVTHRLFDAREIPAVLEAFQRAAKRFANE